jgi:plastocyanin
MKTRCQTLVVALLALVLLAPGALASDHLVLMTNYTFIPVNLVVAAGDSVTWTNPTINPHDTTSDSALWTSPDFRQGSSFSYQFAFGGQYPYRCSLHVLENMVGNVAVTNLPPTVSIRSPVSGAVYGAPASILLQAVAAGHGGAVRQVEFFEETNFLGAVKTAPYSFEVAGLTNGSYTFYAKAIDSATNTGVSVPVVVTVTTVELLSPAERPDGSFQFSVSGLVSGKTNWIEASSDLSHWAAVGTNTPAFKDASPLPFRFYRAVVLP